MVVAAAAHRAQRPEAEGQFGPEPPGHGSQRPRVLGIIDLQAETQGGAIELQAGTADRGAAAQRAALRRCAELGVGARDTI